MLSPMVRPAILLILLLSLAEARAQTPAASPSGLRRPEGHLLPRQCRWPLEAAAPVYPMPEFILSRDNLPEPPTILVARQHALCDGQHSPPSSVLHLHSPTGASRDVENARIAPGRVRANSFR